MLKVNKFPPALITYEKELPDNSGAYAMGPFIWVKEKYKSDVGILEHELNHVKKFYIVSIISCLIILLISYLFSLPNYLVLFGFFVDFILYSWVPKYKLWAEVMAFRAQLKCSTDVENDAKSFGNRLSLYYDLDISKEDATKLILGETL